VTFRERELRYDPAVAGNRYYNYALLWDSSTGLTIETERSLDPPIDWQSAPFMLISPDGKHLFRSTVVAPHTCHSTRHIVGEDLTLTAGITFAEPAASLPLTGCSIVNRSNIDGSYVSVYSTHTNLLPKPPAYDEPANPEITFGLSF
jgi:hypothetical protein